MFYLKAFEPNQILKQKLSFKISNTKWSSWKYTHKQHYTNTYILEYVFTCAYMHVQQWMEKGAMNLKENKDEWVC